MPKFVYVFSEKDKEKLLADGYELIKDDAGNGIFIFVSQPNFRYVLGDTSFVESDTLTF